jgi:outer membrane protein assembly factor BamA
VLAQEKSSLSFDIKNIKSEKVHVRKITFSGNEITKEKIIIRDMSLHEGDNIETKKIEEELIYNKERILNLQLFSTVNYQVKIIEKDSIDVNYSVTELFYWIAKPMFSLADRNFNVWFKEQHMALDRTNYGGEITRRNFRGRNEEIISSIQLGYNKFFGFSYKIPYIDKNLKQGIGISASYLTGREVNFETYKNKLLFYRNEQYPHLKIQGKLHYFYRRKYTTVHEVQFSYNHYEITQELFDKNSDYLGGKTKINYLELSYIHQFNNTNVRIYPTKGLEMKTTFSKRGLGNDKVVNRFEIVNQTSYFHPIWKNISAAFIFRGRFAAPQEQPYLFNRAMGFKNDFIRGYEYYVIDGSHFALLRTNIRYRFVDQVIHQNVVKLMKYIPIRIYGKIYNDIGYVYNVRPETSFLNNKLLDGYGAGLDIVVSYYLKFRIEYSFNHLHQKGLFLHGSKE